MITKPLEAASREHIHIFFIYCGIASFKCHLSIKRESMKARQLFIFLLTDKRENLTFIKCKQRSIASVHIHVFFSAETGFSGED